MTEQDKDRQLLELVKTLRALHGEVVSLRVEHERHVEQLRQVSGHLTSGPCLLHVTDGRLVDGKGADVFLPGHLDFAGVLGRLRDVESRLATGRFSACGTRCAASCAGSDRVGCVSAPRGPRRLGVSLRPSLRHQPVAGLVWIGHDPKDRPSALARLASAERLRWTGCGWAGRGVWRRGQTQCIPEGSSRRWRVERCHGT